MVRAPVWRYAASTGSKACNLTSVSAGSAAASESRTTPTRAKQRASGPSSSAQRNATKNVALHRRCWNAVTAALSG